MTASAAGIPRRFAVISTVLNEAGGITDWLEALAHQSRLPTEVIVCDGGSQDRPGKGEPPS